MTVAGTLLSLAYWSKGILTQLLPNKCIYKDQRQCNVKWNTVHVLHNVYKLLSSFAAVDWFTAPATVLEGNNANAHLNMHKRIVSHGQLA